MANIRKKTVKIQPFSNFERAAKKTKQLSQLPNDELKNKALRQKLDCFWTGALTCWLHVHG